MNAIKLIPVILSFVLLAAHFLRAGLMPLVVLLLLAPFLLFIRKAWVARLTQAVLVLGALEWLRTMLLLIHMRQVTGQPWTRLAIILGIVTAFTGFSALIFCSKSLKLRYRLTNSSIDNIE